MKVSIITVCRNSAEWIEQAIQSVVAQTYPEIEYLVIDGASEDETPAIVGRYSQHVTRFVSEPDRGIYQAMNKGIHLATGEFLYFLNSDDYLYDPDVIRDLVQFVQEHPDCDFVYGDHEARFAFGKSSIHKPAPVDRVLEEMICLGECIMQPASFFKADLFTRLGTFNEGYKIAADYEWFARLLQDSTLKLYYYPRVFVSYSHGGVSSQIRPLFEEVFAIQNSIPLYQSDYWLKQRMLKLQASFIDKYDRLEKTHHLSQKREQHILRLEAKVNALEAKLGSTQPSLSALQAKINALNAEVAAMKTSKFWQLRSLWFRFKKKLGLPTTD